MLLNDLPSVKGVWPIPSHGCGCVSHAYVDGVYQVGVANPITWVWLCQSCICGWRLSSRCGQSHHMGVVVSVMRMWMASIK